MKNSPDHDRARLLRQRRELLHILEELTDWYDSRAVSTRYRMSPRMWVHCKAVLRRIQVEVEQEKRK